MSGANLNIQGIIDMMFKKLAVGIIASIMAVSTANAALITYDIAYGEANALEAENKFLFNSWSYVTEDFNGFENHKGNSGIAGGTIQENYVATDTEFSTNVGTFKVTQSALNDNGEVNPENLMIESNLTGEFGRDMSKTDSDFWLDSNDTQQVTWNLTGFDASFNGLGFYLIDANDNGASLIIRYKNGINKNIKIDTRLANGNVAYISLKAHSSILGASLVFDNNGDRNNKNTTNDGWAIDNVSIVKVPEPTTLAILGLGMIGLFISVRR